MTHNSSKWCIQDLAVWKSNRKKLQIGLQKSKARARGYRAELWIPFRTTIRRNIRRTNFLSHTGDTYSRVDQSQIDTRGTRHEYSNDWVSHRLSLRFVWPKLKLPGHRHPTALRSWSHHTRCQPPWPWVALNENSVKTQAPTARYIRPWTPGPNNTILTERQWNFKPGAQLPKWHLKKSSSCRTGSEKR